MKAGKWAILVMVLLFLFSVGCATGGASGGGTLTNIGYPMGGGGYQRPTP